MGMSTHIIGFRPPDEKFKKMKQIYDSCVDIGITVPDEVCKFFGDEDPDDAGVEVDIMEAAKKFDGDYKDGYEVSIDKLPKDVKVIRFYNSY